MPIATACPHCGANYRLSDQVAGKQVRCAKCGTVWRAMPGIAEAGGEPDQEVAGGGQGREDHRAFQDERGLRSARSERVAVRCFATALCSAA